LLGDEFVGGACDCVLLWGCGGEGLRVDDVGGLAVGSACRMFRELALDCELATESPREGEVFAVVGGVELDEAREQL